MPVIDFPFVDSRTDYILSSAVAGLPVVGSIYRAWDAVSYLDDYIGNRGLSYGDIRYPTMTGAFGAVSSASSGLMNFVSSNIEKLYSNDNSAIDREVRRRLKSAYGVW
jgi:hypothetical protein